MSRQRRSLLSATSKRWNAGELVVGVLLVFCVAGALLGLVTLLGGPAPTNAHPYIANNPGQATLRFGLGAIILAIVFRLIRRTRRRRDTSRQSLTRGRSVRMNSSDWYCWWWRDAPQFARHFYLRMVLVAVPLAAIFFAMALLMDAVRRMGLLGLTALMVAVAAILSLVWRVAVARWETRLVQRLRAADCKLCPRCGYDLTGHDGPTNCPECGSVVDLGEVMKVWHSFRPRFSGERV